MQRLVFGVARITANIPLDLDSSTTDIQLYPKRSLNGTPFHVPEPRKAIVGLCCLTLPAAFAEVRLTLALLGPPGTLAYSLGFRAYGRQDMVKTCLVPWRALTPILSKPKVFVVHPVRVCDGMRLLFLAVFAVCT